MVGSSKKKRNWKRTIKAFLPDFQSPEGMKPRALKNLYTFLVQLSSNAQWREKTLVGSHDFDIEICHEGSKLAFEDICELSRVIFKELEERFVPVFVKLYGTSANKDLGESSSSSVLFEDIEVVHLLFRCCMLFLTFFERQFNLILEKGPILMKVLGLLISANSVPETGNHTFVFEKSVFSECASEEDGCSTSSIEGFTASLQFLEPYNPLLFLQTMMLEVFVDELLAHRNLTRYFRIISSVAANSEKLFDPLSAHGDTGVVIEAICNHFILSFSDKKAFGDFLSQLLSTHAIEHKFPSRAPALGVTSAVSLLLNPIMVSAPKYVQAHLISLVSEAVHVKSLKPDRKLTNCFLSAFEKSVTLYVTHTCFLQPNDYFNLCGGFTSNPPFELYVSPETKIKVDNLISKLDNSSNQALSGSFFRMKSDLVSSSLRFVKECQSGYAISCQEEMLSILSCLILRASESYDNEAIQPTEVKTLQHIYLLASLLKLMSITLLQAIWCLRDTDDCLKTLKHFTLCKEYDFILGTITCFRDLDISLPLQQDLSSLMSSHSEKHMDSKMMFLHLSGLMSRSFVSGLECLVKPCLLTIYALLNLFVFEEGDLGALRSLVNSNKESVSPELPIVRFQETVIGQNSSLVVASRFCKIRSLYSSAIQDKHNVKERSCSLNVAGASKMEAVKCLEEETEETTNGEIFLKCMFGTEGVSDFDDIVDFIECKQGKDYSSWLKNRQRYRKWKSEKLAVLKWKRKKKTLKILKGRRLIPL